MIFRPRSSSLARRIVRLLLLALPILPSTSFALPKRLVIALDGISYRDMKALQAGVTYKDTHGFQFHRQGFHQGYFPVSRMISTFPSTSDVAWTAARLSAHLFQRRREFGNVRQRHHHLDGA
jgi:hypothetical protein